MEMLSNFVEWFTTFFSTDDPQSFWVSLQAQYVLGVIQVKILLLQNAWQVASALINQLQITQTLQSYLNDLPSEIVVWLSVFRVPDCINILLNAHATRFVMRVLG